MFYDRLLEKSDRFKKKFLGRNVSFRTFLGSVVVSDLHMTPKTLGGFSLDGGHRPSPSPTSRHNEEMENPCLLSLYSAYFFEILTRESPGNNLSRSRIRISVH